MTAFDEIQSTISTISRASGLATVGIGRRQRGSGVIIAPGHVVTNAHNVRGPSVTITFSDGTLAVGQVAGVDVDGDLAVVAVETGDRQPATWGPPDQLQVGTVVFGAAASSSGGPRITFGTVSGVATVFRGPGGSRIEGSVEHTAPLAPGASGGALLDAKGRIVGINTSRLGEGFYLARPADEGLRDRVAALGRGETPDRPRLGVAVAPSHVARRLRRSVGLPDRDGLLVRGVEDGSPAAGAGIQAGDLIVEVAGRPVVTADELAEAIAAGGAGPYALQLVRGAEEITATVAASSGSRRRRARGDA